MGQYLDKLKRVEPAQVAGTHSPHDSAQGRAVIEPATPNAKPIYWETGDGHILGPAIPEFLGRDGETFWIVTTFENGTWWINADRLRSKKAFDTQPIVRTIELLREPR